MYRVLIADDEARDRNIIKILLERKYAGQFQILEAENGDQALEAMRQEQVQLLLLDINMPGLSGIDVLHRMSYMPYVIVLTAHSCFEYTREALRCGVRDYLLKPPLREEFYRAVDLFFQDIERMLEPAGITIQSREVFTRDLAKQLMYYGDQKKIRGLMDVLGVEDRHALCGILHCRVEATQDSSYLLDEVEETLDSLKMDYAAAGCDGGVAVMLFSPTETITPRLMQTFTQLSSHLEDNLCAEVQVQMGNLVSVSTGYPKAFLNLLKAEQASSELLLTPVQMAGLEKSVCRGDFGAVMEALQPMLEDLGRTDHEDLVRYQLITVLSQCAKQMLIGANLKKANQKISSLISAEGREQATEITARYIRWLLREREASDRPQNNVVQTVLEQVRRDCSRPWTMEALADRLHVNAYYLSHLFKEYTGQCFTDYLAEQRICRAVELMKTSDLSFAQIGEEVGYDDPNYFSRVFKKRKGVGPRAFSKALKLAQH